MLLGKDPLISKCHALEKGVFRAQRRMPNLQMIDTILRTVKVNILGITWLTSFSPIWDESFFKEMATLEGFALWK